MSGLEVSSSTPPGPLAQSNPNTDLNIRVITTLSDRLRASDVEIRGAALQEVITAGADEAPVVPEVILLLEDQTLLANCEEIRLLAIEALTEIGPDAEDAIPSLITLLGDEDTFTAAHAAIALASIGRDAVPPLIDVLNTGEVRSQLLASLALGEMGPDAESAIPALERIWRGDLVDRQPFLRHRPTPSLPQPPTPITPRLPLSTPHPLTISPSSCPTHSQTLRTRLPCPR